MFWLKVKNNWNAVCLAGTTGAALALEDSLQKRAWFVAAAEHYITNFLKSFTPDGYCSEGVGYWNYGFGHFVTLAETIRQATNGKEDLFAQPNVVLPALFGFRSEIINGVYPSIADCSPGTHPSRSIMQYVAQRLDVTNWPGITDRLPVNPHSLAETAWGLFQERPLPVAQRASDINDSPLRTWFNDGGVLIARPERDSGSQFAVALKGGDNAENHNHNDVGSFSVVLGKKMVICDPGGEVYTRRTFSGKRYESDVLNSYGHAVPIVAGKLQRSGAKAKGVVVLTNFTESADTLVLDIQSAYAVPELTKLERTFVYHRKDGGSLDVSDEVEFSKPETFESALITWGAWRQISQNVLEIKDGKEAVLVRIETGGLPFKVESRTIDEHVHTPKKPEHIGIMLESPVTSAKVSLSIHPAEKPQQSGDHDVRNGQSGETKK